jgi:hypothetical protein
MQDLKLVGVHDDGQHLVLSAPDGQKYLLVVDDPLRAAVRLDRARLGQLQIETEGKLRPRDIQARIRAGQTAEEVAEAAELPVEHVRRFEGPVLAEREFVVRQAQAVRVRHGGKGSAATLGELVTERLAARAVEEDQLVWDAWRGDDGGWVVTLTFTAGSRERQARWSYDAQLRHVMPRDDESRWLTEDDVEEPGSRHRRLTTVGGTARREDPAGADGPIRDRVYDIEADGGVRPAEEPRPAAAAAATVDLLDSLRERRGRRQRTSPPGDPELAGGTFSIDPMLMDPISADPMDAALHGGASTADRFGAFNDPPAAHPPASRPDLAADAEVLLLDADGVATLEPQLLHDHAAAAAMPAPASATAGTPADPAGGTASGDQPGTDRAPVRRGRRPSVPKWDDIVFGSRRE